MVIGERICRRCKKTKPTSQFDKPANNLRRLRTCRECYAGDGIIKQDKSEEEINRIKAIMSVPVNIQKTQAYYMGKFSIAKEQKLGVL